MICSSLINQSTKPYRQLLIKASNGVNHDKYYSTQRLIVYVRDYNDNHPIFTNPKINGTTHCQKMTANKTVLQISVSLWYIS